MVIIVIIPGGTVVVGSGGETVDTVLQVLNHGVVSQGADHGRGIQIGEQQVFWSGVFYHVPALGGGVVRMGRVYLLF